MKNGRGKRPFELASTMSLSMVKCQAMARMPLLSDSAKSR